jgi:uncharacterized protein (TIGR02466 family)
MAEYNINALFPSAVMESQYNSWSEDDTTLAKKLLKNLDTGIYNWYSKDHYILNTYFPNLKKYIEDSVQVYAQHVLVGAPFNKSEFDFRITQSWLNLCKGSSRGHHLHTHQNSVISGVFYIKVDEEVDVIQFHDRKPLDTISVAAKTFNDFNTNVRSFKVHNGQLLIFPSSLGHSVPQLQSTNDRISLSFNTFPYGSIGNDLALEALTVK